MGNPQNVVLPYFSATQIAMYRDCRPRYYDRYVAKTAKDTLDTSAFFGSALHKAIELHYSTGVNPQYAFKNTLQDSFDNATTEITMRTSYANMIEKGNDILRAFPFSELRIVQTEKRIELPFPVNKPLCTMVFIIDAIDDEENVYDFKSSSKKPTRADLARNIQFNLYWYAYNQVYGKYPNSLLWYHLRDHTRVVFNPDQHTQIINEIIGTVFDMVTDDYFDIGPGKCANCVPWCHRNAT